MEAFVWYSQLIRPSWAPPAWLFGPVWTVLYVLIFISFGSVLLALWQKQNGAKSKKINFQIALPFILNIIFNLLFTPIQFGLRNNILAAVDILLVLGTLIWAIIVIYPRRKWVAYMQVPYLLWVSFATILQLTITYLNV